jgi:hypothetical protein
VEDTSVKIMDACQRKEKLVEGFTGQTPTPLNRSNPDLTPTPQFGETNVIFGIFGVFFMICDVFRISKHFEKSQIFSVLTGV